MDARADLEAGGGHPLAEGPGARLQPVAQLGRLREQLEGPDRRPRHHGGQGVGKEVGPAALAQQVDHVAAARDASAGGAAQRLAERRGEDVHRGPAVLGRAAAGLPHEAGGVGVVDQDERAVPLGQRHDLAQRRHVTVHGEDPVGHDHPEAGPGGVDELRLQVAHVRVLVDQPLRLAQPDAVDDGGVVQPVGEDRVVGAEQRLEDAAVGVEAGRVEDRVLHPEEGGHAPLQLQVQGLGPADEADAGHPVAPLLERAVGGGQQLGVPGQAEVVVGAEVQDRAVPAFDADLRPLVAADGPFLLPQALLPDLAQLARQELVEPWVHGWPPDRILPEPVPRLGRTARVC